jgi:hypothetical protein
MSLHKTDKARAELAPGARCLGQRERTLLLLADGTKSQDALGGLFDGQAGAIVRKLLQDGYLEHRTTDHTAPLQVTRAPKPAGSTSPSGASTLRPVAHATHHRVATLAETQSPSDPFEGKRSLATTRMFLFDICERMFARRDPALAERFRESLRQARDREGMLAAGRDMIAEIEKVAGHERADSISERVAMLLPPELVT